MSNVAHNWVIQTRNPYEIIASEAWENLAPGVQLGLTPPLEAAGVLKVERATTGIAGFIARMILLPPNGEKVEAHLSLIVSGEAVQWTRSFGLMMAVSRQTFSTHTYIEEAGPFKMVFRLVSQGTALAHSQVSTRIFGIPVPMFLGPLVVGLMSEGPTDRSWRLDVDIRHQWFGRICRYEGVMHAQ